MAVPERVSGERGVSSAMWSKRLQTVFVASLSLLGCGVQEVQSAEPASVVAQQVTSKPIALEQVPTTIHRRAAQLLEDTRGTDSAPAWKGAVFAPDVQVLFRPDVQGVAYYEFSVLVDGKPSGYIIASAADHDFPIAHWNFEGLAPSQTLAKTAGTAVSAYYKLDALTYLAEGTKGEQLALLGAMPPRIVGQDPSWLSKSVEPTTAAWKPDQATADDSKPEGITGKLVITGPKSNADLKLDGWSSWAQLKEGYGASYGTMAASLKNRPRGSGRRSPTPRRRGRGWWWAGPCPWRCCGPSRASS